MIDTILVIAGSVGLGTFAALELHSAMRQLRRQRNSGHQLPPVRNPPPMPTVLPPKEAAGRQQQRLEQLARDLLDPDMYGYAVSQEVRNAARTALGRASIKATSK